MSTLMWDDTSISECPSCGATAHVGIMSLSATCACGMYYADVTGRRGWYFSRECYEKGEAPLPVAPGPLSVTFRDGREILRITSDGEIIVNPGFTATEVARAFWQAVQKGYSSPDRRP